MNYSGPEMALWRWLGEAGDPLSLRAPCPARDFGTHTPCPSPASAFPLATGNATSCGDVAQPRQGSVPKGWGRPWVLPGCAAGAGARPCCGSCRCPRGPCCVTRVCLAPAGSGDVSRQRQELKVPGAATTAPHGTRRVPRVPGARLGTQQLPLGTPGWGHQDGDSAVPSMHPAMAQHHLAGGAQRRQPWGQKTPQNQGAQTLSPFSPAQGHRGWFGPCRPRCHRCPRPPPRHHGSPRTPPAAGLGAAPLQQAALCAGAVARGGRTALPLCCAGEAAAGARGLRRAGSAPRSSGWEQGAPGGRYPRCGVGFGVGMRLGQ